MVKIILLLNAAFIANTTALPTEPSSNIVPRGVPADKLADAKNNYKGIHWDDTANDCTEEQFDVLVEATRMALEMTKYDPNNVASPVSKGSSSHQNHGRP